jgi:DNA repair exonuclease SbcCD ATPase subunit
MRLKSIRLQNIRSFLDATIEFPESGLVLIQGRDADSGESSGAGKTSVLLGIAFALDLLPEGFSAKDLQSWNTDKSMQVDLVLDDDGKDVLLRRGKVTSVDFGHKKVEGASSYPGALKELFKMPSEIISALTYRNQDASGFFLSMGPTAKVEFLTKVLGLEAIEAAVKEAQDKIKTLEESLSTQHVFLSSAVTRKEAAVAEEVPPDIDLALLKAALDVDDQNKTSIVDKIAETERQVSEIRSLTKKERQADIAHHVTKIEQARAFLTKLRSEDNARLKEVREVENRDRQALQRVTLALQRLETQDSKVAQLKRELGKLEVGQCPTCERDWDLAEGKRSAIQAQISSLEVEAQGKVVYTKQKKELEAQLSSQPAWEPNPKIEQLREIEAKLSEELKWLDRPPVIPQELSDRLMSLRSDLSRAEAKRNSSYTNLQVAQTNLKSRQALIVRKQKSIETTSKEVAELEEKILRITKDCNAEKDFVAAMGRGGFLGLVFEEVLREIAAETNKRLGSLANVSRASVSFTTETEKGARKIQAWVDIGGHRAKLKAGPSGGQQTSLDQIADLAVVSVITRRVGGKVPQWMALDEIFNGQGRVTKEAALEVLQEFARDRLVLVIDHSSELAECFDKSIDIVYKSGVSSVA